MDTNNSEKLSALATLFLRFEEVEQSEKERLEREIEKLWEREIGKQAQKQNVSATIKGIDIAGAVASTVLNLTTGGVSGLVIDVAKKFLVDNDREIKKLTEETKERIKEKKKNIVSTFTVPKSKEDILELLDHIYLKIEQDKELWDDIFRVILVRAERNFSKDEEFQQEISKYKSQYKNRKMKNTKILIAIAIIVLATTIAAFIGFGTKKEKTKFVKEVAELQEIFESAAVKQKKTQSYDLEETIRIIHGLDIAKKESKSFFEFCEFMARQDYSKVAFDVIEAKTKLFPILNELSLAEKELEKEQSLWNTFASLSGVVVSGAVSGGISFAQQNYIGMTNGIIGTANESFAAIQKQKELEENIKKKITSIQNEYIKYLENFTPIYLKYMDEWDKICLFRDNAYLDLHNGNIEAMLINTNEALKIDSKNREANILKAFGLLMKSQLEPQIILPQNSNSEEEINSENNTEEQPIFLKETPPNRQIYLGEAKEILDDYIANNPKRSAPALLLMGTYYSLTGDMDKAITMYEHSAAEYPRQSEELLDMLNSYKQRIYLRKSAEGAYILQLYKTTMEGYGFFSPNFQKALIAKNNNDLKTAKEEILKHFFRRGNQGVYDYMIADMVHCEKYLPESFNMIFKEKSFLDLEATTGMFSSKNLNLKINNRSDIKLSNVRVFLCLHLTDMYKDDYEVIKMNTTVNRIEPHSVVDFGKAEIDFELFDKRKNAENDIVTARAIVVTDDVIAWVDEVDFKINSIKQSYNHYNENVNSVLEFDTYYSSFGLKGEDVLNNIKRGTSVESKITMMGKDVLNIKLPRNLVLLNPYFSINELNTKEVVFPSSLKLNGSTIDIQLNEKVPKNGKLDFYLTSEKAKIKWEFFFNEDGKMKNFLVNLI